MKFRTRLFLAFVLVLLIPLGVLAVGVRREMERRVTAEYRERVASLVEVIRLDLERESGLLGARLAQLRDALAEDNRFRLAAVRGDPTARRWLLDWGGGALRLAGLDYLRLQDDSGRVLSSGHFRNEFDRVDPLVPRFLAAAGDSVSLLRARTAEEELLLLARTDSFTLAGRTFTLAGGMTVDPARLGRAAQARGLSVIVALPGDSTPGAGTEALAAAFPLRFVDASRDPEPVPGAARIVVMQTLAPLDALRRGVDAWFLGALVMTAVVALAAAAWLSVRISRPLRELAAQTEQVDLDHLDVGFATDRADEIGALSRLLGAMTERLGQSSRRLREVERRAAVGDLARQVNHDVKNGLIPIRHVLAHLAETAERNPGALPDVFRERRGTLESSVAYLESLARNYARLSPAVTREPCDVNALAREAARGAPGGADVRLELADRLPPLLGDRVVIRRILENLVTNAAESLDSRSGGSVTLTTGLATDAAGPRVRIVVADTGRGMTRQELDRAFDDFYTTKPGGSGLGLTIVRRLVQDLGGSLRVETEPGAGSRFIVDLDAK